MLFNLIGCYSIPKHLISEYGTYSHSDSDKLKINGYYYTVDSMTVHGERLEPRIKWFILYEDGTLLQSFQTISDYKGLGNFENTHFIDPLEGYDYTEYSDKKNTWWGAYSIIDSTITFQYFVFFDNWVAIERKGEIINDSQINMFYSKSLNGYQKNSGGFDSGIFRFKEFTQKPDSLNWMMTDKYYQNKVNTIKLMNSDE